MNSAAQVRRRRACRSWPSAEIMYTEPRGEASVVSPRGPASQKYLTIGW